MKKGFSLVEMTIVLTIILTLFAVTLKGKELIYQARLRTDFAKIRVVKQAIGEYIAENPRLSSGMIRYQNDNCPQRTLFSEIMKKLETSDMHLKTTGATITLTNTAITEVRNANNSASRFIYSQPNTQTGCVTNSNSYIPMQAISFVTKQEYKSFGCQMDAVFDDSTQSSGDIVAYLPSYSGSGIPSSVSTNPIPFNRCGNITRAADYGIILFTF